MILSDRDIKAAIAQGRLAFKPKLTSTQVGPASIDLRLADTFLVFRSGRHLEVDPKKGVPPDYMEKVVMKDRPFVLHPNNFVLASTREYLTVPDDLAVIVEGKSTLARIGILVHTAGFVDPGFDGTLTLEISNQASLPVLLYPSMFVCQILFHQLTSPAEHPYHRRKTKSYRGRRGPGVAQTRANLF